MGRRLSRREVEYGIEHWFHYFQEIAAFPQMSMPGNNAREMIDFINDTGFGAIGTPEMCRAQIDRLWKQSNGGFGAYLLLAHNWANFEATKKSYDLIAREVFPHFQGQHRATMEAAIRAQKMRPDLAAIHSKIVETARPAYPTPMFRALNVGSGLSNAIKRALRASETGCVPVENYIDYGNLPVRHRSWAAQSRLPLNGRRHSPRKGAQSA